MSIIVIIITDTKTKMSMRSSGLRASTIFVCKICLNNSLQSNPKLCH